MPLTSTLTVINKKGLHARASVKLSELAESFNAEITLSNDKTTSNAKNVLQLMMLAASQHATLSLHCSGPDQEQAQQAIADLFQRYFDEDE